MRKILGLVGLMLASVLSVGTANAGFVTIDTFDVANFGPVEGGNRSEGFFTAPGNGLITLNAGFSGIVYTSLAGMQGNTALLLEGIDTSNLTSSGVTVVATVQGIALGPANANLSAGGTSLLLQFAGSLQGASGVTLTVSGGTGSFAFSTLTAVPEPTTIALLGLASCGGCGAALRRFRRKVQAA